MGNVYDEAYTIGMRPIFQRMSYDRPVCTFLSDYVFGGPEITSTEKQVLSQFRLRGSKVMDDDRRGDEPQLIDGTVGHKNRYYTPLYYCKKSVVTEEDFETLCYGEDPANPWSAERRILSKLAEKAWTIKENLKATKEARCADVLFRGKITPKGNAEGDIEFLKDGTDFPVAGNIYNDPTGKWNASGADVYKNLVGITKKEKQKRGILPNTLVCDSDTMDRIISNAQIREMLNNRRYEVGYIAPKEIRGDGANEVGWIKLHNGCKLLLVTYDWSYEDSDGTSKPVIPANTVLLCRPNIGQFGYGCISGIKDGKPDKFVGKEKVTAMANNDIPAFFKTTYQSACLPMPIELDGWAAVKTIW